MQFGISGAMPLGGFGVVLTHDLRRYGKLPDDVQVTPEFRAEFNAWAAEFFQPDPALNALPDGRCLSLHGTVYMNPRTFAALKNQTIRT